MPIKCLLPFLKCISSNEECDTSFPNTIATIKLETLPNELLLDIFDFLNLFDLYYSCYGLNWRLSQLILSKKQSLTLFSKHEFDFSLKSILPNIHCVKVKAVQLWYNTSFQKMPRFLILNRCSSFLHTLILNSMKNLSFENVHSLTKQFPQLHTLKIVDLNTPEADWLEDINWNQLVELDLLYLRSLYVKICIIYLKEMHDDDRDNIIYSFTSRFHQPPNRLYTGECIQNKYPLQICLMIDKEFSIPRRP
ncbi:unnamed protein product [Didymodactylos carnosus]|uniref:F-box domain-containing protein n=1 Tax=Didymodactylos carnosus TaxID=1234261 RepID=A0A8S2DIW0_9BILA|nr:unnamed protein product [Didymodactylos carnosus]CAF3684645.1 unnamed protein product [Didymodactylos carnosus]